MLRFNTEWRTSWQGHAIIVRNWWDLYCCTGEELWVDGRLKDHRGGMTLRLTSTLTGTCRTDDNAFVVRAHLWPLDGVRVGCHIFVNDELVGGDVLNKPWTLA
ncbi:MAG: hypothetical protein OHK0029_33900 [Armatimonadaceae bacterium]